MVSAAKPTEAEFAQSADKTIVSTVVRESQEKTAAPSLPAHGAEVTKSLQPGLQLNVTAEKQGQLTIMAKMEEVASSFSAEARAKEGHASPPEVTRGYTNPAPNSEAQSS